MNDGRKRFWTSIGRFKSAAKCLHKATGLKLSRAQELLAQIYGFRNFYEVGACLAMEHPLSDVDGPPSPNTEAYRVSCVIAALEGAGVMLPTRPGQTEPDYLALFAPVGEMKRRLGVTGVLKEVSQDGARCD
jgi:hypothetical protein